MTDLQRTVDASAGETEMESKRFITLIIGIAMILIAIPATFLLFDLSNNNFERITLATTTSTDNSGLLDYLHPYLTQDTGLAVDVVAVGTGAALEQARQGLADVVIVHARILEDQFIAEGYGIHRVDIMYNDFIIVGPQNDPAGIQEMTNSTDIFHKLYQSRDSIVFVSRGDNSGTYLKELSLWDAAGINMIGDDPQWAQQNPWYLETGSGMADTLIIAYESSAYTLTDRGTWLFTKDNYNLVLLAEGSPKWQNPYGAILVNPEKFNPGSIEFDEAKRYIQWLISDKGQFLIDNYSIKGEQLFFAGFKDHFNELPSEELVFWGLSSTPYLSKKITLLKTEYWQKDDD